MRAPWGVRRACVAALVLSGCTPTTTRPSFAPIPEALHAVINARPADVTRAAQELLKADTISIRFVNLRDAFLETDDFAGTHRLRLWADPDVTRAAQELLKADTISIRFVNLRDAFLETDDFAGTHR